jgi:phosphotransferase system HPr-like phosphotransfer protein
MPPKKQKPLDLDLKEGTFTRMAKEKGYGSDVQKFASDIMKHKDKGVLPNGKKITKLMIKKANFVKVSRKWKKG